MLSSYFFHKNITNVRKKRIEMIKKIEKIEILILVSRTCHTTHVQLKRFHDFSVILCPYDDSYPAKLLFQKYTT